MNKRIVIQEVIVVEGKDDVAAVKRACEAKTIITSGLGISKKTLADIRAAKERCGVIVLTDPDGPGEKIRHIINQAIPGCKQARLQSRSKDMAQPIGVEYASPSEILEALRRAKPTEFVGERLDTFSLSDMIDLGLTGSAGAKAKRDWLSQRLGIGMPNGKQFLERLNAYRISRIDFESAYQELIHENGQNQQQ